MPFDGTGDILSNDHGGARFLNVHRIRTAMVPLSGARLSQNRLIVVYGTS